MITSLLLLATVAGPVGFDHTAHVSWAAGDGQTRAKGVDSSASELGARGIRLRAEAKTPRGWLGVLDLDLTPSTVGPLNVGPELRARYDELTPKGVGFHGGKATGTSTRPRRAFLRAWRARRSTSPRGTSEPKARTIAAAASPAR